MAFRLLANPSRLITVISECLMIILKNSPTGSAVYTYTRARAAVLVSFPLQSTVYLNIIKILCARILCANDRGVCLCVMRVLTSIRHVLYH
jgi:hypothetical protein